MDAGEDFKRDHDHYYISNLITDIFSQKMFKKVSEFYSHKKIDDNEESDSEDEAAPGYYQDN